MWFEGAFESVVQMLGVTFHLDTVPMYCSVPEDKVKKATDAITIALALPWVPAELTQVLLGILAFHGRVLLAGRWHLSFSVQALKTACGCGVAPMLVLWSDELKWWSELLTSWNRVSLLVPRQFTVFDEQPFTTPFTDASRSKQKKSGGAGACFGKFYMMFAFSKHECTHLNIMELEGLVVVLWLTWLCENHPDEVRGKRFISRCDNDPFVVAVNDRKSKFPTIAFLLGELHQLQCKYSFDLRLRYIKSKDNLCADLLSRDAFDLFAAYMLTTFRIPVGDLVCVAVQNTRRSYMVSSMISIRRAVDTLLTPRFTGKAAPTGSGHGSANTSAAV